MTLFNEILSKYELEEQATEINKLMKQATKPFKNSRKFASQTGLGVVFSVVEKYFYRNNYIFDGGKNMFVKKEKADKEEVKNINDMIINYIMNEDKGTIRKGTFQMYEGAEKELKEIYSKYPYFNKSELLYVVIMEGVKNLK